MAIPKLLSSFSLRNKKQKRPLAQGQAGVLRNLTDKARQQDVPMQAQSVSFWLMVRALHCGIDSLCMIA
jgi:hypothetical protein